MELLNIHCETFCLGPGEIQWNSKLFDNLSVLAVKISPSFPHCLLIF